MKDEFTIDLAKVFSSTPGGRYKREGLFSAQEFREDFLEPALREHQVVIVDLDGPIGVLPSFLEEVFGGAVRALGPEEGTRVIPKAEKFPLRASLAQNYQEEAILGLEDD